MSLMRGTPGERSHADDDRGATGARRRASEIRPPARDGAGNARKSPRHAPAENSTHQPARERPHEPIDAGRGTMVRQVELILSQVSSLPTLSPIAARLMTVAGADDADLGEIAQIIESDPGLAARILGLCRRADRGLAQRVMGVKHAVTLLGLDAVRACVLSVQIYDMMRSARPRGARLPEDDADPAAPGAFDRPGFWRHSIATACTCEMLAEEIAGSDVGPEEAFLAGLVHDLGTLALEFVLPRSYQRVVELAERRRESGATVEREVLGIDRYAAGRRLATHWRLPETIVDVVWLHGQSPESLPDARRRRLVALVTLAREYCRSLHLGWCADFSPLRELEELCAPLGLDPAALGALAEPLQRAVSERCGLLGLDRPPSTRVLLDALGGANRQLARLTTLLQERARLTSQQTRALSALRGFHAEHGGARGLVETLACVASSAAGLIGAAPCDILVRTPEGDESRSQEPWRLYSFVVDSTDPVRCRMVAWRPVKAGDSGAERARAIGQIGSARGVAMHGLELGDATCPAAILLCTVDPRAALGHETIAGALSAAWGGTIRAALEAEEARVLSDRLADVGRALLEAQSRLAETESMVRLGEMTAGAAHEMNNPLTVISGRSQLLAARLGDASDRACAEAIAEAADDLSGLVTSLHLLSSPPRPRAGAAAPGAIVDRALAHTEERLKFRPRVQRRIDGSAASAWADAELAAVALAELIVNAVEAAPGIEPEIGVFADPERSRVVFEVSDRGPGMSRHALQHAFDPFFSEKPAGRQRGLGLTRARRLVEIQSGRVTLVLRDGGGARAMIELPVAEPPQDPAPGVSAAPQAA